MPGSCRDLNTLLGCMQDVQGIQGLFYTRVGELKFNTTCSACTKCYNISSIKLTQSTICCWWSDVSIWTCAYRLVIGNPAIGSCSTRVSHDTGIDAGSIFTCRVIWTVIILGATSSRWCISCKISCCINANVEKITQVALMNTYAFDKHLEDYQQNQENICSALHVCSYHSRHFGRSL